MNRLKESNVFSGGVVIPLNNRRTLLKSYIWNYVVSNSGKATLENSIKGDIDLELIGNSVQPTTTGKNLFDLTKIKNGFVGSAENGFSVVQDNRFPSSVYLDMIIPLKAGQTLNISGVEQDTCRIRVKYDTGVYYLKYTANKDAEIMICFHSGLSEDDKRNLMVEISDEPTSYEPYQEPQTLTLTSDRPITKWDKLVEQGGSMGWLYSGKIAKEFTFVSKASDENISGRIRRRFKTSLNGKFPQTDKVMCNFLTTDNVRNDYSIGIVGSGDIYIYFYENTGVETLEQANHWLKNLPFEKTIIFERKTTEFVPLSESEQTQLRNLHSYNGTTNITVDSGDVPCGIKVVYKQKK